LVKKRPNISRGKEMPSCPYGVRVGVVVVAHTPEGSNKEGGESLLNILITAKK